MNFELIVHTITYFSSILPVVIGLLVFGKISKPYKILFFFCLYTSIQEVIRWIFFDGHFDKLVLNAYTFLETLFIGITYQCLLATTRWKNSLKYALLFLVLFFLFNLFFFQGPFVMNSISLMLESIFFILLATKMFFQLSFNMPSQSLLKHPVFWFNTAVFGYFSINFFNFMLSETLYTNTDLDFNGFHLWDVHDLINLFFNCGFAIALWLAGAKRLERRSTLYPS